MSRADNYQWNDDKKDEIDQSLQFLKSTFHNYFSRITGVVERFSDEEIINLTQYIRYLARNHGEKSLFSDASLDKIKVLILLFSKLSDSTDTDRILSYLEAGEFGWHGTRYHLSNPCLMRFLYDPEGHCKKNDTITTTELAADILADVCDIFFNDELSSVMLLVFNYCLASGYSSMLNAGGISVPLFLQIAVDQSSNTYQLLKEIVEICDVNSGLNENCNKSYFTHERCGFAHQIYFPTQSCAKDIDELIYNFKDRPVLIVGYENERNYASLLREIANIPTKRKALDLRQRFNLLPIFVCPAIKSSFDNVLSIDLTGVEISSEYLGLIRRNKQRLASWVLALVVNTDKYRPQEDDVADRRQRVPHRSIISNVISPYINRACQDHSNLTRDNAKNVGFLNYFFRSYLDTIRRLCTFPVDEKFEFFDMDDTHPCQDITEIMDIFAKVSDKSLAQIHHRYLPAPTGVAVKDKAAMSLAKLIEKHYRTLKVYIRVIPSEVKEDRYIFTVDTLNETKDIDVKNGDC